MDPKCIQELREIYPKYYSRCCLARYVLNRLHIALSYVRVKVKGNVVDIGCDGTFLVKREAFRN